MLHYILYTIFTLFLWMFLLLSLDKPGEIGVFLTLLYSFYSTYFIKRFVEKETLILTLIKFAGPVFYVSIAVVMTIMYRNEPFIASLLNPIIVAFLIFSVGSISKRSFPTTEVQFFVVAFSYLYAFSVHGYIENISKQANQLPNFTLPTINQDSLALANNTLSLADFQFINQTKDTLRLSTNNQYTILETWNERCPPCLQAIPALKGFYKSLAKKAQQRYVYVSPTRNPVDYAQVFAFEPIGDASRILMNVNLQQELKLESYPVFMVFDPSGQLVLLEKGFSIARQNELENKIKAVIK